MFLCLISKQLKIPFNITHSISSTTTWIKERAEKSYHFLSTYCFSTATMINWTHLNIMFICILPVKFKLKFYEFSLCLSRDSVSVTPELTADKQCSTTTLNTIMACNIQTGFKERFYKSMRYIEARPPQLNTSSHRNILIRPLIMTQEDLI